MRLLITGMLAASLLAVALAPAAEAPGGAWPMRFGSDRASVAALTSLGIRPDYGQFWAGVWNERSGWASLGTAADQLADQGVIPVIEWWYWGDDISRACVTNGCMDRYQGLWKDRAHWRSDAIALANALHNGLQGRAGIVIIESEFNKNDIQTWETFDGYLAEHARIFRERAPELRLALGFGNWNSQYWGTFDRAVAAMNKTAFQTMRASTRDSVTGYLGAVDAIADATSRLRATFPGKAVLLHDLALSSYTEPTWAVHQEDVVQTLFLRVGSLRSAGLEGIIYRALNDNPNANPANYYGQAERHWGLRHADGSPKIALNDWVEGVRAVRAG